MGQAKIVSGGDSGRYTVTPVYKIDNAEAVLSNLKVEKSTLEGQIQPLLTEISYQQELLANLVDQAIADANDGQLSAGYLAEIAEKKTLIGNATLQLSSIKVRLRSVEKDIDKYSKLVSPASKSVWCADFSENLRGTVETIEMGREQPMIIAPSGTGGSGGGLKPVAVMTPAQAFLDYAMLPGANRWRAHFAEAVVSNVDDDSNCCSVMLVATTSSHQNLPAVIAKAVDGVPISYMHCNAKAFSNGDRALVRLAGDADQTVVEVIGFISSPEVCPVEIIGPQNCDDGSVYYVLGGKSPYVWDISAVEFSISADPTFIQATNPETGLDDGSAIEITNVDGCCGSGLVEVSASLGGSAEKSVRLPLGAWRATHFEWSHLGIVNYTENVTCCTQATMDTKVGTFWEKLCDFDSVDPCVLPANTNAELMLEACCGIVYSASTQLKRVDEHASLNNGQAIEYSDGEIAFIEYGTNLLPTDYGLDHTEFSPVENCPQWIKDLPTSAEQRGAVGTCLNSSFADPTPLSKIDISLPPDESIEDYEIAVPANDPPEIWRIVGRQFFIWQCDEFSGEDSHDAFVFNGITPL